MKRWALLVIFAYLLMLVILAFPALLVFTNTSPSEILEHYREAFGSLFGWIWIGALVLGEAILLLVPVSIAQRRLKPRRRLLIPIFATIFFLWVMAMCAGACVCMALWDEKSHRQPPTETQFLALFIVATLGFWLFWTLVFLRYRRETAPSALTSRLMRYLLAGSILELLIAIPSHIIVRQRDECCSPAMTGLGIYTGVAVMLMSFGPGVFILYAQRRTQLVGRHRICRVCGYDLRATPDRCPECGTRRDIARAGL